MRDPVYKVIGSVISRRRKQLKMKQEALAKQLAISRGSLANIETGRQGILVHQLYRIANALELAPTDLLPPAENLSSLDEWTEKLPSGLNPVQQAQVARLFEDTNPASTSQRKTPYARTPKHKSAKAG
jgi:transcriptional regulator with XRE-family HTH domain